ncbi:MAG: EAL domain-containing protein [Methylomarinum sp.]|nr:EAL domain-containing protein [Methylomarinum sp.]
MKSSLDIKPINQTIVVIALVCGLLAAGLTHFKLLEEWNYDIQNLLFSKPSSKDIVVIAIDDKSLQQLGRWPWSRAIHANMIKQLTKTKVRAVGLDILFMEQDIKNPVSDQALAKAIKQNAHVVLPTLIEESAANKTLVTPPFALLSQAANQLAATRISFDSRGIVNGVHLNTHDNKTSYPSLALAILMADSQQAFSTDKSNFPEFIPFTDSLNDFQQLSYADVLVNPDLQHSLENKFIIISATATGLSQRFATPTTRHKELMNGAELTVNTLASLLNQNVIQSLNVNWTRSLSFICVFIPLLCYGFVSTRQTLAILASAIIINISISLVLLSNFLLWYNPLESLIILILSYSLWSNYRQELIAQALLSEKDKTQATLHSIADGIITTDSKGIITFINPAAEIITGVSSEYAFGKKFQQVVCLKNPSEAAPLTQAISNGKEIKIPQPLYVTNAQQQEYAVSFAVNPIFHRNKSSSLVIALTDVSEIIKINKKMLHLATHDALTGLPNRTLLGAKISEAIAASKQANHQLAILFIDLDGFKKINDGLGHAVGDELLIEISQRLTHSINETDTAARWGGDEFILLLTQLTNEQQIHDIAKRVLESINEAVIVNNQELFVSSSIGISCYPKDATSAESLLDAADSAMYKVKEMGRDGYHFYNHNISNHAKQHLNLERELHHALIDNQFEMFYQLQVDLISGRIIGVEALIRWRHPEKGLLSPDKFIPLAEKVGLIIPISAWIVEEVCLQLNRWQKMQMPELYVAINFSARQFMEKNLVSQLKENIQNQQLKSHHIHVEITESLMLTHLNHVENTLKELKAMGITIAIDDFGTGYSSLSFLKRFEIDILKIDRSFVQNIFDNNDDSSIIAAVSSLAHSMKITLVAEGIENVRQCALLKQLGCHIGQGFYFSRPLTATAMTEVLQSSNGVFQNQKNFRTKK